MCVCIYIYIYLYKGLPRWSSGKESTYHCRRLDLSLGPERHLEEEMATHSSILAWKFPWTKESVWDTVHRVAKM